MRPSLGTASNLEKIVVTTPSQTLKTWPQRAVPEAITSFLTEYAPGTPVPKTKEARIRLFWDTLLALTWDQTLDQLLLFLKLWSAGAWC